MVTATLLRPETGDTEPGLIVGTPMYMSPEQVVGAPLTAAADIYGLGMLLYWCLHGEVPGDPVDYLQLLASRIEPVIVPPSPPQNLLERCLAVDPVQRPSAREVLDKLQGIATGELPSRQNVDARHWPVRRPGTATPYAVRAPLMPGKTVLAAASVVVVGCSLAWWLAPATAGAGFWVRVITGLFVVAFALLLAQWMWRLMGRASNPAHRAVGILTGAGSREALTDSMVIEVEQVVAKLKRLDAKFLGLTIVMLIREAEEAKESTDRVAALAQMVALMEMLTKQLSPWYMRHKEAIATGIAIAGSLAGVASVVSGFLR